MLEIKNLNIKIEDRYLIKDLSLTLNNKDKLAIIGEEGNGKSTLLKAIIGNCDYANITGTINLKGHRIGYLEQSMNVANLKKTGYNYLFESDNDYYNKVNNLYKYLKLINLEDEILTQAINTLSGGEKVKLSILKLLLDEYDILFLDEPTNDLDIETLEWLENFINQTTKPIIYISHDETLLAATANTILHIEQLMKKTTPQHTLLKCDYNTYIEQRLRKISKQNQLAKSDKREFDKQQAKLNKVMMKVEYRQNTISRKDPHGAKVLKKKMHSLKTQEKKLDNTKLTKQADVEESINFFFENITNPKGKRILSLELKELKVGNKILSKNIKLDIVGNQHLCIIGKNGVGKSTLIKEIYNRLKNRDDIKVGYMPQVYEDILSNYKYVLDFLAPSQSMEDITRARTYLGNMNFTKEEMTTKISNLSNGTKAKLFLIKLVIEQCNVLILDEPTRNVSPLSNPIIRKVLKEYQGTIISISHDRKYIDEVIDTLYILEKDGLIRNK